MNLLLPSPPLAVEANFPFHFVFTPRFFTSLKGFVMQWIRTLLSFIFMHATSEEEQRKLFSRPNDQKALCMCPSIADCYATVCTFYLHSTLAEHALGRGHRILDLLRKRVFIYVYHYHLIQNVEESFSGKVIL